MTGSTNKKKPEVHYEFNGPIGAVGIIVGLPLVIFGLYFGCNAQQVVPLNPFAPDFLAFKNPFAQLTSDEIFNLFINRESMVLFLSWFFLHFILYFILPGEVAQGVPLDKQGNRLNYPINGQSDYSQIQSLMHQINTCSRP
jgi:delta14-sterol reductase